MAGVAEWGVQEGLRLRALKEAGEGQGAPEPTALATREELGAAERRDKVARVDRVEKVDKADKAVTGVLADLLRSIRRATTQAVLARTLTQGASVYPT